MQLTVVEGLEFIDIPDVQVALNSLIDANLGYIKLGQSLDTMSGGETQRLKIATKLVDVHLENAEIFILDEPSTGLHETDIKHLLSMFNKLKKIGKTLIVLEHNLTIISQADWIIDMGLKGGDLGGKVLFEGFPIDLIKQQNSFTGKHLRKYLEK